MTSKNENDGLRGKRYIRLVRCSTKGQADTSINDQLALLAAFAQRYEMVHVDDLILEGVSVSTPKTFVDDLIARKKSRNDFDVVLIQDTSRLTRGGSQHGSKLEWDLRAAGIQVVFALDGVPEGDFADLIKGMKYLSGQQTAKQISKNATRGAQSALEQGRIGYSRRAAFAIDRLYTAPDGTPKYIIRNLADGTQLKLDPSTGAVVDRFAKTVNAYNHNRKQKDELVVYILGEASQVDTVRRIFNRRFLDGWGQHRIAQELNDTGLLGPSGKDWSMTAVMRLLKNPIYTARTIANQSTRCIYNMRSPSEPTPVVHDLQILNERKRPPIRIRPSEEWIWDDEPMLKDFLEPRVRELAIVQQDIWLAAKAGGYTPKFDRDRHRDSKYILKNILTAKQNGSPLTGQLRGRKPNWKRYYAVSHSFHRPKQADRVLRKAVLAKPLEELILNVVRITLLSAPALRTTLKREIDNAMRATGDVGLRMKKLTEQLADLKRQVDFVIKNVSAIGEDESAVRLATLKRQRDEVQQTLSAEQASGAIAVEDADTVADRLVVMLSTAGKAMDLRCQPALRSLLQTLVAKAEVDLETGNLDLELRLPKSALATQDWRCLVNASYRRQSDEAHQDGILLLRMSVVRLSTMYIAYRRAA